MSYIRGEALFAEPRALQEKEQRSMENQTTRGAGNRRDFLIKTGKQALWMAPTLTVLMTASSQPAKATFKYGGEHNYTYKKYKLFKFFSFFWRH
jgi:hypothetical protein